MLPNVIVQEKSNVFMKACNLLELEMGTNFNITRGMEKCLSHVAKMHIFNMNNDALNSYISHKHHCWVVLNLP